MTDPAPRRGAGPAELRSDATGWHLAVCLLAGGLTYALTSFRDVPLVSADEIGYLGIARYLTRGTGPQFWDVEYYHFGVSVLYMPAEALGGDPGTVYAFAIALNAALVAVAAFLLFRIGDVLFETPSRLVLAVVLIVSLWPSQFVHAHIAWGETLFRAIFLGIVLAALTVVRNGSGAASVTLGVLCAALYAVHPRGLPFAPLCVVYLGWLGFRGVLPWRWTAAGSAAAAAGIAATMALNDHLHEVLWMGGMSGMDKIASIVSATLEPGGMARFFLRLAGQGWYQVCASYGLAVVGAGVAVSFWRQDRCRLVRPALLFVALGVAGVCAASAAQLLEPGRFDHLIYGRYIDGVSMLFVWLGLMTIATRVPHMRLWPAWTIAAAAACGGGALVYLRYRGADLAPLQTISVAGLHPVIGLISALREPGWSLFAMVSACATAGIVLLALLARRPGVALAVLAAYLLAGDWHMSHAFRSRTVDQHARLAVSAALFAHVGDKPLHVDRSARTSDGYIEQYVLIDEPFVWVELSQTRPADGAYVLVAPSTRDLVRGVCIGRLEDGRLLYRVGPRSVDCFP